MESKERHFTIDIAKKYEKYLAKLLILLMIMVLTLSTLDLISELYRYVIDPPFMMLNIEELLDIFGLFMLVLIGLEFLETIIKTYLQDGQRHYQVVLSVALIAISRKVIILDVKHLEGITLLGISAIIIAISFSYYIMKKAVHLKEG
jgi:uncharacterized membrane protein (DUF373 family)